MATERELNILIKAKDEASRILKKYDQEFTAMGQGLMAAGAAGAAGLGYTIKAAADFQSEMSRVGALSQASDKELKSLTDTAMELGAKTKYSSKEAAQGMQYLAMAGYETNDIISAMPGLLDMAAAGQIDLGSAADITSNVLSGFQMAAKDTGKVADVLAKTFTSSNTDLQMLGETMKYVAPVASAAGFSLEEMAAATGLMGNAGIQGSQAGTSLRGIIMRLQAPTSEAAGAMEELGINVRNADGSMKSMPDILAEFESGLSGVDQATKDMALKQIIGMEAAAGFQALLNEGSGTLREYAGELEGSAGTAAEIAAKQMDNLKGALEILKGVLETTAITIGTYFLPPLQKAAEMVSGFLGWVNTLDPSIHKMIGSVMLAGTIFGLLTGAIMIVTPMLPAFGAAIAALLSPLGLIILAVGALGTAFAMNLGGIRDTVMSFVQPAITAFQYLTGGMDETVATGQRMGLGLEEILGTKAFAIVNILTLMRDNIVTIFNTLRDTLLPIVMQVWTNIQTFIQTYGLQIVTTIQWAFQLAQTIVMTVFQFIATFIQTYGVQIVNTVTSIFTSIWNVISVALVIAQTIVTTVWSHIQQLIATHGATIQATVMNLFTAVQQTIQTVSQIIVSIIQWAWPYISQIINMVMTQVVPFLISMFTKISAFISDVMPKIVKIIQWAWQNVIQPLLTAVMNFLVPFIQSAWSAISNIIGGALDFVMGIVKFAVSVLTGDWSGAWEAIKQTLSGAVQAIKGILQAIGTILSAPFKAGLELIKGLATSFYSVGSDLIQGLINGIKDMAGKAIEAAKGAVKGALDAAKNLLGINSPSRVFMEIGAFTSEGLAIGITKAAGEAKRASQDLARAAMTPMDRMTAPSFAGAAAASAGSDGGRTINLHFGQGALSLPNVTNGEEFVKSVEGFSLRQAFKSQ